MEDWRQRTRLLLGEEKMERLQQELHLRVSEFAQRHYGMILQSFLKLKLKSLNQYLEKIQLRVCRRV